MRRATPRGGSCYLDNIISIHALLAESDCYSLRHSAQGRHFYPRSPCGERRGLSCNGRRYYFISIHALLAESDIVHALKFADLVLFLSTLSLRRATANWFDLWGWAEYFYPRSPCGERHVIFLFYNSLCQISIHALLAESDGPAGGRTNSTPDFYPRSPCGERLRPTGRPA